MFSIENDVIFLNECGFLKGDKNFLYKEIKNILLELNENYVDHIINQEESILEKFLESKRNNTLIAFLKMFVMNVR